MESGFWGGFSFIRASFIQLDPPVNGSAGLVLFLGADQLDDPPGTPIPLYGSL